MRCETMLRAVAETVAPATIGLDAAGWREVTREVDATLATRPRLERAQVTLLLLAIEWLTLLTQGARFSRLHPAARARVLDRWSRARSPLVRAGTWGVRTLALLGVYGRTSAWADLGYRPDPRGWEARS